MAGSVQSVSALMSKTAWCKGSCLQICMYTARVCKGSKVSTSQASSLVHRLASCFAHGGSSCCRHVKAALHALDQLNSLAWQQSLHDGNRSILPHDKLKASALDELQSSLSMPDQISADLARPLLASAVDEVRAITT